MLRRVGVWSSDVCPRACSRAKWLAAVERRAYNENRVFMNAQPIEVIAGVAIDSAKVTQAVRRNTGESRTNPLPQRQPAYQLRRL